MSENTGMAKSVESVQPANIIQAKDTKPLGHHTAIVHDEIYKFFNIASFDNFNKGHLNTINRWALKEGSLGTGLKKLMQLETKLGAPHVGETRMSKLFNWIRLSDNINSVRDTMQTELHSVRNKTKNAISDVQGSFKDRLHKVDTEISNLTKDYKKAEVHYKLNATIDSKKIRNKYGKQLEELRQMRTAFKGGR